jgi:hypothetical protein
MIYRNVKRLAINRAVCKKTDRNGRQKIWVNGGNMLKELKKLAPATSGRIYDNVS